jgi:hypothetical protein
MDDPIREAMRRLRSSAAEYGHPLDHLTDAEIVEGVGIVSLQLSREGHAVELMKAGIAKIGKSFIDLQRAGFIDADQRRAPSNREAIESGKQMR